MANEPNKKIGRITAIDTKYGLLLKPDLSGLQTTLMPGIHGFHIHENPSCDNSAMAAGGHFTKAKMNNHLGPYNNLGHVGDLPAIYINIDGTSSLPVLAPRLTVKKILGHSLIIHQGGDNYSDNPPLGGGGARLVCGVIPNKAGTDKAKS